MKIYKLAHNTIDNEDYLKMIKFLREKKHLTQSIVTKKFEKNFSNFLKLKYSTFVNSGSSANLLIAQTLLEGNFLKNKIVVLPAVSWSTTVSPYLQLGFKVILCDCDQKNLGLSIWHLEKICKNLEPEFPYCKILSTFEKIWYQGLGCFCPKLYLLAGSFDSIFLCIF